MGLGHSHDHHHHDPDARATARRASARSRSAWSSSALTAAIQLVIVVGVRLGRPVRRHRAQLLRRADRRPLWIAFALSRRAATRRYTYGLGRVEDLAGLFVVAMIALSAVVAAVEAIRRLVDPVPLAHLGWVAAAGVVGFVGNEVVAVYRIRVGRRIGSAALRADGLHARADGLTSLAVVAGAAGVRSGLSGCRPDRRPAHRGRHRGGDGRRGPRRVRSAAGPCRPRVSSTPPTTCSRRQPGVRAVRRVRMRWVGHRLEADVELDVDTAVVAGRGPPPRARRRTCNSPMRFRNWSMRSCTPTRRTTPTWSAAELQAQFGVATPSAGSRTVHSAVGELAPPTGVRN